MMRAAGIARRARKLPNRALRPLGLRIVRAAPPPTTPPKPPAPVYSKRPLFVGYTRFSILDPGRSAFKLSRGGEEDAYAAALFAPDRLRPRADAFLGIAAPLLQAMGEGRDYRHIVHYSNRLPEPYLGDLLEAARANPVLYPLCAEDGVTMTQAMTDLAREHRARVVVQFRVDDDDVLAVDFLDHLAPFARIEDAGRSVNLASGYAAYLDGEGRVHAPRIEERPFASCGQAYIGTFDLRTGRLRLDAKGQHTRMYRIRPHIVRAGPPTFLRLLHPGQDTRLDAGEAMRAIHAELDRRAPADPAEVLTHFPTLADRLVPPPEPLHTAVAPPPGDVTA